MMNIMTDKPQEFSFDAVVVGGGMAGLTACSYLCRAGISTALFEKEHVLGGLVNSFTRDGYTFDGGIRAIENSGIVDPMLRELNIEVDYLPNLVSVGLGKDVIHISDRDSVHEYQEMLISHFPENINDISLITNELRKIIDYMDILYGIDNPLFMDLSNMKYLYHEVLPWMIRYVSTLPKLKDLYQPVHQYLMRFSHNSALLDIIDQHFFRDTPAYFALSYFTLYLDYRYPKGGTGSLPMALESYIGRLGASIQKSNPITEVKPAKKTLLDSHGNTIHYNYLIWAADLKTLYNRIDTPRITNQKIRREIEKRKKLLESKKGGDSVFTVYLSINRPPEIFRQISGPHFFYTPDQSGLSQAMQRYQRTTSNPLTSKNKNEIWAYLRDFVFYNTFEISIPVLRDPTLAPEGKTGLVVSFLFDYALTKQIHELGWYDEMRQYLTELTLEALDNSIYPGIIKDMIHCFSSTPLSLEKITGNSDGAITGWAFTNQPIPAIHKLPEIAKSINTPIPHIFQAGQWTYSPSGLPISILTGKLAAERVIKALKR